MLEYRYDTQLLIEGARMSEEEIARAISEIPGDSLLAVGDSEMMKIHYHTNVPWKVLELRSTIGEIYDIIVEDMERLSHGLQG